MGKQEAEWSNRFSIFWLKKHGYLPAGGGWGSGGITWTWGASDNKSSMGFTVATNNQDISGNGNYVELRYTRTDRWTQEKEAFEYKVELTTTPCNYGGARYWFRCPLVRNGHYCGRRVGVLYNVGKYFGCRKCGDIAYSAQMKGGKYRGRSVTESDVERLEKEIKRNVYNGRLTRKYRRLIRMKAALADDWIMMARCFSR